MKKIKKKKTKKISVKCNHIWNGSMFLKNDFYVIRSCCLCGLTQYLKGKWVILKKEKV